MFLKDMFYFVRHNVSMPNLSNLLPEAGRSLQCNIILWFSEKILWHKLYVQNVAGSVRQKHLKEKKTEQNN